MEMIFCPGCAANLQSGTGTCPVCGIPRAAPGAPGPQRNPFKLIALCVLYAIGIWFASMFVTASALGVLDPGAHGEHLGRMSGGPLLLTSIGLSIALTVCGTLPGTAKTAGLKA
jgi:hypothetical protein